MCHPQIKVYYSNFVLSDVVSGSLIECRNPMYQQAVQMHGAADAAVSKPMLARSSTISPSQQVRHAARGAISSCAHALLHSGDGWSGCAPSCMPSCRLVLLLLQRDSLILKRQSCARLAEIRRDALCSLFRSVSQ